MPAGWTLLWRLTPRPPHSTRHRQGLPPVRPLLLDVDRLFCNITAGIAIIASSHRCSDLWHKVDPTLTAAALASMGATLIGVTSCSTVSAGSSGAESRIRSGGRGRSRSCSAPKSWCSPSSPGTRAHGSSPPCSVTSRCATAALRHHAVVRVDVFGAKLMPVVYGTILTAWSAAGVVGPQMVGIIGTAGPQAGYWLPGRPGFRQRRLSDHVRPQQPAVLGQRVAHASSTPQGNHGCPFSCRHGGRLACCRPDTLGAVSHRGMPEYCEHTVVDGPERSSHAPSQRAVAGPAASHPQPEPPSNRRTRRGRAR